MKKRFKHTLLGHIVIFMFILLKLSCFWKSDEKYNDGHTLLLPRASLKGEEVGYQNQSKSKQMLWKQEKARVPYQVSANQVAR